MYYVIIIIIVIVINIILYTVIRKVLCVTESTIIICDRRKNKTIHNTGYAIIIHIH